MYVAPATLSADADVIAELHIAGIVVHAVPARIASIKRAIGMMPNAQVHAVTPEGKLVVTLEARHTSEVAEQLAAIHVLPGVYSAALVYQHHEDLDSLNEEVADDAHAPRIY
jgi:nitrate reductase NapD